MIIYLCTNILYLKGVIKNGKFKNQRNNVQYVCINGRWRKGS